MNRAELLAQWRREASLGMTGWDFSHLNGRYLPPALPWDYAAKARDFLKPGVRLLDMGTGGGEFLLTLGHPYALTSVTEGWPPNLALCQQRLAPLGITVKEYDSEQGQPLPFEDDSFDLVLSRHESYDLSEVRRVLKNGGYFLTQQVGGENDLPSSAACSRATSAASWASTWKTSSPNSGPPASGCSKASSPTAKAAFSTWPPWSTR